MQPERYLTLDDICDALKLSSAEARWALRRYPPPGTLYANGGRWFVPTERLNDLRWVINKGSEGKVDQVGQPADNRKVIEQVNIYEAKTQLSALVERAGAGEEIVIARSGKPVARLMPLERPSFRRTPGACRGEFTMGADFDELPPDLVAAFGDA